MVDMKYLVFPTFFLILLLREGYVLSLIIFHSVQSRYNLVRIGTKNVLGRTKVYSRKSIVLSVKRSNASTETLLITRSTRDDSHPELPKYVRWKGLQESYYDQEEIQHSMKQGNDITSQTIEMQTAITVFRHPTRPEISVELHAQLHFGDDNYYKYYNSLDFNTKDVIVLYELIVDEALLTKQHISDELSNRALHLTSSRLKQNGLQASPKDQDLANKYGWICQVDGIDYIGNTRNFNNWIHADVTRQELDQYQMLIKQKLSYNQQPNQQIFDFLKTVQDFLQPVGVASEAVTSLLFGPPMVLLSQQQRQGRQRRLFTNLFLAGDSLAVFLRWALWLTVPSPELSILLLDSSSMWLENDGVNFNKENYKSSPSLMSAFSPIVVPLIQALATGQIQSFRKLLFGQVIVATNDVINPNSNNNNNTDDWNVIVQHRNDVALEVLQNSINTRKTSDRINYKLVYGCSHCPDLHQKLVQLGFTPIQTKWRTAWSVEGLPSKKNTQQNISNNQVLPVAIMLVLYLIIGALDWISSLQDVISLLTTARSDQPDLEICTDIVLYLIRHTLLYVGLSRFLLDWKRS